MVSVLHKELECKGKKFKYKKFYVMQPGIRIQLVNKPSWTRISSHEVVQQWLINTVYLLLVENN